ncbi:hypothetical protein MESS4_610030 [Mesorhizobium sp. STM 4661]|nr:hypothetical protein MESS4_610030 [Mesorhizobium sp. STM 4661]
MGSHSVAADLLDQCFRNAHNRCHRSPSQLKRAPNHHHSAGTRTRQTAWGTFTVGAVAAETRAGEALKGPRNRIKGSQLLLTKHA